MAASYWYCLTHKTVEEEHECKLGDRLGPYATRADGEQALAKARQRTADEDARDRADNDWGTPPARQ